MVLVHVRTCAQVMPIALAVKSAVPMVAAMCACQLFLSLTIPLLKPVLPHPFPFVTFLAAKSHEACGDSNLCCPTGCGSTCMTALTPARPCYETASYASSLNLIGSYVPQCNADGTYMAKQTHGSTGMSWCVDTTTGKALTVPTSDASLSCSVSSKNSNH